MVSAMRTVSAREANQRFSKLLEAAVGGEEVTITRHGVPVAKLVPLPSAADSVERERRRRAALEWLESGALAGGTLDDWTREELYDRDADRRETPGCE
jgi:prevent-host-death family protein